MRIHVRILLSWLITTMFAFAATAQTSLHYWDFNTGVSGTPWGATIAATQTVGSGSLTHGFGNNTDAFAGSTQDAPGFTTATAGAAFCIVSSASNNKSFILNVPTTGHKNIVLTYSTRGTSTGFDTHTIAYTTDGTNYTDFATITGRTSTSFSLQTVDFSAVTNANDNANFKIRVTVSGATNASGNNRIDNIRITGTQLAANNTIGVAAGTNAVEGGTNGSFNISLSPQTSSGITVNYAFTGTAAFGADYTVSFTGATSSSATATGTLTIPANTSSVTATISAIDDGVTEGTETVVLTLSGATGGYTLNPATATINITEVVANVISFTGSYTQDFNTLSNSGQSSTLPAGWLMYETGGNANTMYSASDGSSNSGDTYSFGTTSSTERAFGGLRSSNLVPTIGAIISNNTGGTLTSFQITYTGEQWRLGATGRSDKLDFQYSLTATSLSNGTWIDVDGLDFIAPVSSGTVGALNGNATGNRTTLTYVINGLSIPAGAKFMICWLDADAAGADDGLGIDDVSFSLGCTPPSNQPTALSLTPALQSVSGSFTAATAGTTAADSYVVLMSTSSTLTAAPVSGTVYNIDDEIGNAEVVAVGNATSFTVTGLTPSTTYYFYVFSAVSATNCYNAASPLIGSTTTTTPPACAAPGTQASSLSAANITGTAIDISYTRGSGDKVLVLARATDAINAAPINSLDYPVGSEIGTGNFVVYNGSAAGFTHSGLTQNTVYNYAVYEYYSANFCYTATPLTGSFTTACTMPVNVSAFGAGVGNGLINLTWTAPSTGCFDEIIIVASNATVTGAGSSYTGTSNTVYSGGEQIVYRGTGNAVTVTGLTNGTVYYFKAFTRKGAVYSAGIQVTGTPFDPATGYQYLFGNIHSHSSYSDGNKDNLAKTPKDDYEFARDALCMDFLGISEHNHSGAGMSYPNFKLGYNQANQVNGVASGSGNSIVTLYGMEWGVISGGGHVLVYGFGSDLIGWESSNYDIYVAKSVYTDLWPVINNRAGSFASLAHPNSSDYNNLAGAYNTVADNAIVGVAVESGPAFSTSKTYNDFPSSLSYLNYYKTLLARGYHVSPEMDQDNHNMTFGTANTNRLVVLASGKTREAIMEALRAGRFYASQDCNVRVDFRSGTSVMGSLVVKSGLPSLTLSVTDPDAETVSSIELWGGVSGGSVPSGALKTYSGVDNFTFNSGDAENVQPNNSNYYYFAIITQADGNKIVTAPIYYTRSDVALPLNLLTFTATYNKDNKTGELLWTTAAEVNTKEFAIERSTDKGNTWSVIGYINAAGNQSAVSRYKFTDANPQAGTNLYRLKMVDIDAHYTYSAIRSIALNAPGSAYVYSVYPNPAIGYTYLNSTNPVAENVTVNVVDNNGRIVKQLQYNVSSTAPARIDLSGINKGIYFLKILTGKETVIQKVIVQ